MQKVLALVRTWLLIDFFGDARRAGRGHGSSLTTTIFAQSFFAFVFAALLYPDTPPVPFAAANLCLSSLLVAIGALGEEGRPERRAADDHLLVTSPIGRLSVVLARSSHAAFAIVLVTVGMALPPGILLGFLRDDWSLCPGYVLGACVCSGLATGCLGVLARAVTRWSGPARTALLMGSLKAVLLGGGLVLFAMSLPRLQGNADALLIGRTGAELLPPYQVARWLGAPATESWRLLLLAGAGALLLVLSVWLGGRASTSGNKVGHRGPARRLLHRITEPGPGRGIAEFVAIAMWRSAGFRARVLPLLGVPAAMALLTLRGGRNENGYALTCLLLQLPAIYLPFLVAFLPRADQPGTNWVFDQAPELTLGVVQDATWRALVTHVLAPVHAAVLVLLLVVAPARADAAAASLFAFGIAILAARAIVRALDAVPFTRNQADGDGLDLGALFGSAIVLGGLGTAYALWLPVRLRWPVAVAVALIAGWSLWRRQVLAADKTLAPVLATASDVDGARTEDRERNRDPAAAAAADAPQMGRELRAIAVLYAFLCLLPLAVGTIFAG